MPQLPENIVPISICGKAPDWYGGLQYKKLAPKYDFFIKWKETHDNDYYIENFNKQVLSKVTTDTVIIDLFNLAGLDGTEGKEICLICYEKPDEFCHRHLVAEWLSKDGFKTKEWDGIE